MTDEEKEMKEWIEQRRKGSDLMSKLLIRNEELQKENEELKAFESHWEEIEEDAKVIAKENEELKEQIDQLSNDNHVLKTSFITQQEQIEKMKSFIHSEINFCMYCPLTNECVNDEGTCPYAYATEEEQKNLLMDFIQKWELSK